jgi:cell division protein FtsB
MGIKRVITDKIQDTIEHFKDAKKIAELELTVKKLQRENKLLRQTVDAVSLRIREIEKTTKDCGRLINEGVPG